MSVSVYASVQCRGGGQAGAGGRRAFQLWVEGRGGCGRVRTVDLLGYKKSNTDGGGLNFERERPGHHTSEERKSTLGDAKLTQGYFSVTKINFFKSLIRVRGRILNGQPRAS